jgi:GntR family transcriptional regulator, trigonelline degradation regulator
MIANTSPDFLKIVKSPVLLRELAADAIRDAILIGALAPGERLVEAALSKRMGVSRPSIREALSQLAAEKLVTMAPNKGPSVATITWEDAAQIYEVRAMLEGEAAFLFAARSSKEDLIGMRKALREFESAISRHDTAGLLSSTAGFYSFMLLGCGNHIIAELLQGLKARIGVLRARSMSRPGRVKHSLKEMSAMLKALETRDGNAARAATHSHVQAAAVAARDSFNELATKILAG